MSLVKVFAQSASSNMATEHQLACALALVSYKIQTASKMINSLFTLVQKDKEREEAQTLFPLGRPSVN